MRARVWDVVLCAPLVLPLVCVAACGLPGCLVSLGGLVNDRTGYRCASVVVLVGGVVAYCLCRAAVRRLRVLLLYVALAWLLLLLLLLLRLVMSN